MREELLEFDRHDVQEKRPLMGGALLRALADCKAAFRYYFKVNRVAYQRHLAAWHLITA